MHHRKVWQSLMAYIWPSHSLETRIRVVLALGCLLLAQLIGVALPLVYKRLIDSMTQGHSQQAMLVTVPLAIIAGYGILRVMEKAFSELRDAIFIKVAQQAIRDAALRTFQHLHRLSLRFHLERQTGGISRAIQRGSTAMDNLASYMVLSVLPTLIEIVLVAAVLFYFYDYRFSLITLVTIGIYMVYTIRITEWRLRYRKAAVEKDEEANTKAIDSLLNYETVKYFGNEKLEAERFRQAMQGYANAEIKSRITLSVLNVGQGVIIAIGMALIMALAAEGVANGTMTIGDFVLTNTYLLQLYIPLDSLGWIYRSLKDALIDMEAMFGLIEQQPEVEDKPNAAVLQVKKGEVRFENVSFYYDSRRPILSDVSFTLEAGHKLAIVGASGAGKSTIGRLLFRFYDISGGRILIDGQNIADVTQDSLRHAIGIVPQDTVLFNESIAYNIAYGKPESGAEDVRQAARVAQLHDFIQGLPDGYDSEVGERGLKLSGGEKQRVAIARTVLKNPPILIFDEATSALDTKTEKEIQKSLAELAIGHTTIVIAHRLSTVVDAEQILVLDQGRVAESGTHEQLLAKNGLYAALWAKQAKGAENGV